MYPLIMPAVVTNLVERAYFMSCFTDLASAFHIYDRVTKQSMLSHYSISNIGWAGLVLNNSFFVITEHISN